MNIPYGMSPILNGQKAAIKTEIIWCNISSVNPERQTMKVMSSESKEEMEVFINQALSTSGSGIRYMPLPGKTKAIIHSKNGINTHLGYFVDHADIITDNSTGDKQSGFLLQRFLNPGEVQFMGVAQNEVYLDSDGSIFIKSGYNQYIKLDDIDALFDGEFGTLRFEMDGVRLRAGNTRRPPTENKTTNEDEYIIVTDTETNTDSYPKEFTVSVGNIINSDATDYQSQDKFGVDQYPYAGLLSLADTVYNNSGTTETVLEKLLNFLLKFPSGISVSVNQEGALVILDQTNQNYLKFASGSTKSSGTLIHNTELELQINKSNLKVTSTGEFSYTLTNPGTDNSNLNKRVAVNFKKDSAIEIKNTNDGSTFNTVTMDAVGISVSDFNSNSVVMNSSGIVTTDKNGNVITLNSSGTKILDSNANTIVMENGKITITSGSDVITTGSGAIKIDSAAVTITGGDVNITGGNLTTPSGGSASPTGTGGFCGIKKCIFSGVIHNSNSISGT